MKNCKKLFSWILTLAMVFTLPIGSANKAYAEEPENYTITFQNNSAISSSTVTYTVGDETVTITPKVNGAPVSISDDKKITFADADLDKLSFDVTGFDSSKMKALIKKEDGFSSILVANEGTLKLPEGVNFGGDHNLLFDMESSQGQQEPPHEDNQPMSWYDYPNKYLAPGLNLVSKHIGGEEGTITYEFSDDMTNWGSSVTITANQIDKAVEAFAKENPTADELNSAKATFMGIGNGFPKKYVRIKAEGDLGGDHFGAEVFSKDEQGRYSRNDNIELNFWSYEKKAWVSMNSTDHSFEEYIMQVPKGDNPNDKYEGVILDLSRFNSEKDAVKFTLPFDSRKSIGWWNGSYKDKVLVAEKDSPGFNVKEDEWLYNGNAYLVKVVGTDGKVYYSDDPNWKPDTNLQENLQVLVSFPGYGYSNSLRPGYTGAKGGYTAEEMEEAARKAGVGAQIPKGASVTVKMVPDAGYQLLSASINDTPIKPDEGTTSQFTFTVERNMGIVGIFEEASDVVDVASAGKIENATIKNADAAIDSGNVSLTVSDDEKFDTSKATDVVEGTALTAVNVEVDKIVAKGGNLTAEDQKAAKEGTLKVTDDKFWSENMAELNKPIDIALTLDDVELNEGETLAIVREHNGVCEEIETNVNTVDGKTIVSFASDKFSTYTIVKTGHVHKYVVKASKKATTKKNGSGEEICSICGEKKKVTIYAAKKIEIAAKDLAYTGKKIKPDVIVKDSKGNVIDSSNIKKVTYNKTLKNIGTYEVTVTLKGNYSGTLKAKVKVVPATTKISSVKAGSKKLTVTLKGNTKQTTGYEIQIATNSKFTKGVKKVVTEKNTIKKSTFTKLKKGTKYYVRVRTYKLLGEDKYYSEWTNYSKTVKIK